MHVRGAGPVPCVLALVGPYPGYEEDRTGIPFSGRSGQELERFLDGVSLPTRDDLYLTNLHKAYHGRDYVYSSEEARKAEPLLAAELNRVQPTTIITLGREVTRLFLGDVDITDVESIPWVDPNMTSRVIFPLVHIAAGMRNPELSPYVVRGFQALADYLQGNLEPRILFNDPYPEARYEEITTDARLQSRLRGLQAGAPLSIDTEGWPHNPWSLQFSYEAGTGYLIRATAHRLLQRFADIVRRVRPRLLYHSALHDLGMSRSLGVDLDGLAFDDTMVMAYLLQLEPQGLKAACLRHCNMAMQSYDEILGDVGNELARNYLMWLWDAEQVDYEEAQQQAFDGAIKSGRRITVLPKLPKTALHRAISRILQSKRPRALWEDQIEDIHVAGYARLGVLPDATLDYVAPATAISYGCRDADGTTRLLPEYSKRIDAMGLRDVYNLELSTYPFIDRMQRIGLKPDLAHFHELSTVLDSEISTLRGALETATGVQDFNANSGDQVAAYLFETLGLEEVKWTKGGRGSTNDKILEALEHEHPEAPIIGTIRTYREIYKLKHTFVDRLPDFVHRWPHDDRVHATFRTTRVVTGRLAASDPNVLAQPEHGKFAADFKRGWVAEDGHLLCQWDESQIELRGLAHLSQDPVLLRAFHTGTDLHATLAERIFGIKPALQDKSKHRLPAKAINFGIPMGMTCRGLSVELRKNGVDADEETAQHWLDETLDLYVGVKDYMARRIAEAQKCGFVRCLSGRIRYIGGIRSRDDRVREEAERFAFSTPIQESATYIMKQAEATIFQDILVPYWKDNQWVEPILQVHDCIKIECAEGLERDLHEQMTVAMTEVPHGFSVPLAVEGEFGVNMADMQKF